jgi:hypothetical protein
MQTILEPKMRADIEPLCKVHFGKMRGPFGKLGVYVCSEHVCGVYWRPVSSYERVLPDGTLLMETGHIHCPRPGHGAMFLAARDKSSEMWRCSIKGCSECLEVVR